MGRRRVGLRWLEDHCLGVDEDGDEARRPRERSSAMTNGGGHYRFENLGPPGTRRNRTWWAKTKTDIANGEWTSKRS